MDIISHLISDWGRNAPSIKVESMKIVGRIMLLGEKFIDDSEEVVRKFGIGYTDFDVLATLYRQGSPFCLTPTKLCKSVILTSGAMTSCLDRLERKKLITRNYDAKDRRIRTAILTPKGINLIEKCLKPRFEAADNAIKKLSRKERKQMEQLLIKLCDQT